MDRFPETGQPERGTPLVVLLGAPVDPLVGAIRA